MAMGADVRTELVKAVAATIERHAAELTTLDQAIGDQNRRLPRHEQLKAWRVLPERWSTEDGSLTPTLKVKRQVLEKRHAETIEALFKR